ncbi:MAG: hypothetical protein ACLGPM_07820 [Acidobacteriota bacterium]
MNAASLLSRVFAFLEHYEMVRLAEYSDQIHAPAQAPVAVAEYLPLTVQDVSFLCAVRIDPWR